MKPYQFWVKTRCQWNFTIPNVIAGTNYTLYAFGTGARMEPSCRKRKRGQSPAYSTTFRPPRSA
jgi:hypothetical protein